MYTRREFGKMTLAGLPLSLALGRIDSRVDGVRIGVQSYSFRTLPLDEAIKAMSDIGIGECELYSGHVEPRRRQLRGRGRKPPQRPATKHRAHQGCWRSATEGAGRAAEMAPDGADGPLQGHPSQIR